MEREHKSGRASAKRLKLARDVSSPSDSSHGLEREELATNKGETFDLNGEVPDVLDKATNHHPTELESALSQTQSSRSEIADYEFTRSVDGSESSSADLRGRLNSRKWVKGRSSIYVDAFNLALETVLEEEDHLFDETETEIFNEWLHLSYEAQYLYVRLFLRKTSTWHRVARLGYHSDISDLSAAVKDLQAHRALPQPVAQKEHVYPSDPRGSSFTFADASEEHITTLEEASSLLSLEELKTIAKEAKIHGKNKAGLLDALRCMSRRQSGLGWVGFKRSHSLPGFPILKSGHGIKEGNSSSDTNMIPSKQVSEQNITDMSIMAGRSNPTSFENNNRDLHFVLKILANIGPCIRLTLDTLKLFERVHLVYYRSTEWTENSLTTIILARIQQRNFPQYVISRSSNIFQSRCVLLEFEVSIRLQYRIDNILENGTRNKESLEDVMKIFEEVHPRWKILLVEEQRREDEVYESGEGAYLRRFSPAWVYTRIIHKATNVLGRFKMHEQEHEVLTELLDQRLFHTSRRGIWYQRKSILEEHYLAAIQADFVRLNSFGQDQLKKHWKRMSLKTCEEGLQDRDCHIIYHYDLQKRIGKLEKALRIPKSQQHDFSHLNLYKPFETNIEGIQIRYISAEKTSAAATEKRGTKTVWIDETESGGECSVESMCLSWYRTQGWKGYHAEGGIIRTLFAYLFYDILFIYVPNVFQTPYQTCPLDLHTDAFFPSRASEIHHRVIAISNGDAPRLIQEVNDREREHRTCVVGLNWDFDVKDLLEIVSCFEGAALATICMVMAQEYQQRGSGIPDLILWNPKTSQVMFSEVKSENDRLSDTQRLWIHVLVSSGIRVELCNAVAKEIRTRES